MEEVILFALLGNQPGAALDAHVELVAALLPPRGERARTPQYDPVDLRSVWCQSTLGFRFPVCPRPRGRTRYM